MAGTDSKIKQQQQQQQQQQEIPQSNIFMSEYASMVLSIGALHAKW